ncbi:hypothetical protein J2T57_002835 [Natronocella acetinitrilica]|uniref:Uncharacterized protein n=1 Tax=Natronocella acetinitrilica TaxID=414046 RepID=A0AAE3G4I2_9GAMM|nr:hypothetical protein [Natronocella acetinitrilica]MCP1675685.1 hypothetical protein [Natronocella acetinitrilica]
MNSAESVRQEQGNNRVETGITREQRAAELTLEASKRWPENTLAVVLLQALCRLTVARPDATEGFTSIDLCEEVDRQARRSWLADDPSKTVRIYWKKLTKLWEQKLEGLRQRSSDAALDGFPDLDRQEGGGTGNPTRYRLIVRPFPDQSTADSGAPSPVNQEAADIVYICEDLSNPALLARLFHKGLVFHGWRRAAVLTLVAAAMLFSVLLVILLLLTVQFSELRAILVMAAAIAVILWAIWASLGPIVRLPDNRVVIAPWWMQSVHDDRLLVWWKDAPNAPRMIKAARYTAGCPRCGGAVAAKSGRIEFWGRIVGRCEEAPEEHVYTFDHITRKGIRLR